MAQRRFGPTLGPGVVIIEKEAEKLIEAAPLGVTLYATPLAKGDPTKCIATVSKRDMEKKVGGRILGFTGPDAAYDFWNNGNGAGELHFLRVCVQAQLRKASVDIYSREATSDPDGFTASDGKNRAIMRVTAKSGGKWASARRTIYRHLGNVSDVAATTLTTGLTMLTDEWKDGYVALDGVPSKTYKITGNTTAGVVSVSSDADMDSDLGVSTDVGYALIRETDTTVTGLKADLRVALENGDQDPANEFSVVVYENETKVRRWPDLSLDPTSKHYFVNIINDDQGNEWITVADLLTPSDPTVTDRRPANAAGCNSAVTATVLTAVPYQARRTVGVSTPAIALSGSTDAMKYHDTYEFEVTSVTAGGGSDAQISMKSMRLGNGQSIHAAVVAANTNSTVFTFNASTCPFAPTVTITCGATVFSLGDKFQVDYFPFTPSELVGGYICPDFVNKPSARFRIVANTHKTVTVQSGDMTSDGGAGIGDRFAIFYPQPLGGVDRLSAVATSGYDALADLADVDYTNVQLNAGVSPARKLTVENKGLVKVATPGEDATAVVKAGLAFAEAMNWQFRVEIPSTVTSENDAVDHINSTIGRSDFGVVSFPSYAYINDPEKAGQLKLVPLTGMIHGREALVAKQYDGYHKAAAGVDVTLPQIVKLPQGLEDVLLNEEVLNPKGIGIVKKVKGNFILWGDRTISLDPAWKFKHQREQMSHYENRLREGYDFVIFAINDPSLWATLRASIQAMFLPEFVKNALSGKTFAEACVIKIDSENNTDATAADGDLFCDISLKLANTVERFNITIGKAGIFDGVSA